jgi:K(+)-stimulated pyrophosphate-energized sodium pump
MNILIKLTCLIGLVLAPILGGHTETDVPNEPEDTPVRAEGADAMGALEDVADYEDFIS